MKKPDIFRRLGAGFTMGGCMLAAACSGATAGGDSPASRSTSSAASRLPQAGAASAVEGDAGTDQAPLAEPSDDSGPPPPPSSRDAGPGAPLPSCTDLAADGPEVTMVSQPGPAPDLGAGGPIADGVYDLTEFTYFDGGGGSGQERETIRISGGGTRLEYQADHTLSTAGFGMVVSMAPSNNALNDTVTCPPDQPWFNMFVGPYYTATQSTFISEHTGYRKVFVRRP